MQPYNQQAGGYITALDVQPYNQQAGGYMLLFMYFFHYWLVGWCVYCLEVNIGIGTG